MSNKKKELQTSNNALKESLENQIANLADNFDEIGKKALWIGGGLAGAFAMVSLINGTNKKKKRKKIVQQPSTNQDQVFVNTSPKADNLLSSTLKEQVLIFLLGIATQKLTKFLTDLEKEESSNGNK